TILQDYLKQNPSGLFFAGPMSRVAAKAGYPLGAPLTVGSNLKLHPLVSPAALAGPISLPSAAASPSPAIPYSITKTTQAVGLLEAFRGAVEELAKPHPGLDTPLDIVGVLVGSPTLLNAMIKPGPKNKIELGLALGQAAVAIAKVAADFVPGLKHARPALVWMAVFLKVGEQGYVIFAKPEGTCTPALKMTKQPTVTTQQRV